MFGANAFAWAYPAEGAIGGASPPTNLVLPGISGSPVVGQTLTGSNGTWSDDGSPILSRQWNRDGVAIGGATGTTHLLVSADLGKTITFTVTDTDGNGSTSATSAGVGPITSSAVGTMTARSLRRG